MCAPGAGGPGGPLPFVLSAQSVLDLQFGVAGKVSTHCPDAALSDSDRAASGTGSGDGTSKGSPKAQPQVGPAINRRSAVASAYGSVVLGKSMSDDRLRTVLPLMEPC